MTVHFERNLENLKQRLVGFGAVVEEAVDLATRSMLEGDAEMACRVKEGDALLDTTEVEIETN